MDELPFIDEHAIDVAAGPVVVWASLIAVLPRVFGGSGKNRFAAVLGCEDQRLDGRFPAVGSTLVGARVHAVTSPSFLGLEGRHRFSRYRLDFAILPAGADRARVTARTYAVFPGPHGWVYRTLVIGSRAHAVVTRRMLAAVKRRAEG